MQQPSLLARWPRRRPQRQQATSHRQPPLPRIWPRRLRPHRPPHDPSAALPALPRALPATNRLLPRQAFRRRHLTGCSSATRRRALMAGASAAAVASTPTPPPGPTVLCQAPRPRSWLRRLSPPRSARSRRASGASARAQGRPCSHRRVGRRGRQARREASQGRAPAACPSRQRSTTGTTRMSAAARVPSKPCKASTSRL